jgi:lysozyme
LEKREGCRLKAYKDTVGVWTIGYGHTTVAGPPEVTQNLVITQAKADEIFAVDIVKYEKAVAHGIEQAPTSQKQFDAMVSFCYNVGPGGFKKSTALRLHNAGDYPGASKAFLMWNKPPEIFGRRRAESQQYLEKDE